MHNTHDEVDLKLRVHRRIQLTPDVVSLELRDPDGADLPIWAAGAHIDLVSNPDLRRQFSLCSDPRDRSLWQIAVLREPASRGGSAWVHDQVAEGDILDVRGPRNHFRLLPARRYIFIAGGIGITPIMPMVGRARTQGADWTLHYGGRSLPSMAFHDELSRKYGERTHLYPQDQMGLLDLDTILGTPVEDCLIYCCGPEPLLRAAEARCHIWPSGALHLERFAPKDQSEPIRHGNFIVELAQSHLTLTVPSDRSVLDMIEAAGVSVLSSCREGTCGTCETGVLAGTVDHRDSLLTPEEKEANDTMFVCVSRATCERLVLDL